MEESSGASADRDIGPIVWVRRRNGSWWPGQIMETDELADCNLTSPRTGTPVKLLGRDDASVDWYNLEKSKRVKAFRCPEFADCILRAESAQGMPIKKREKYARREDAILHALELEKKMLRKHGSVACDFPSKSSGSVKNELGAFSEGLGDKSAKPEDAKPNQLARGTDTEINNEIHGSLTTTLNTEDGDQPISEEHSDSMLRMRGLQDFGLRTASLKRNLLPTVDLDDSERRSVAINKSQDPSSSAPLVEITTNTNGEEKKGPIFCAKRSRFAYLPADSSDSMDDKELPPSQIKMSPHFENNRFHPHPGSSNEDDTSSGLMEEVESDSSGANSSESVSDSSETEPDIDKEMVVFSDVAVPTEALGQPEAPVDHPSTSSVDSDGSTSSDDPDNLYHDDAFLTNEAVSKWQLKGKRNIRYLTHKSVDMGYEKGSNGAPHGTFRRMKGSSMRQRPYVAGDTDLGRKYMETRMFGLGNRGSSRLMSRDRSSFSHNMINEEDTAWEDLHAFRRCWEDRWEHSNPIFVFRHPFNGKARSMLVDVDLKVQASYQKDRVPIVSLISKLDGKAIIGHPIQIEAVEDGSSETLVPLNDYYGTEAFDHDENTSLTPSWRTARRTNSRVPRPHLSSVLGGDAVADDILFVDQERRVTFGKSNVGSLSDKTNLSRENLPRVPRPPAYRKFSRKLPKRVSSPSNQKTRTLSSIGIKQNYGTKTIHDTSNYQIDGLIKPETSGPTTVACIPVKLVFSRLLEKINRPPSKSAAKVLVPNRDETS